MTWFVDKLGPKPSASRPAAGRVANGAAKAAPANAKQAAPPPRAAASQPAPPPAEPPKKKKGWFG